MTPEWAEKYAGLVAWNLDPPTGGESLEAAARATLNWLNLLQSIYHSIAQKFPSETRATCEAGLCPDYRAYAERLRVALGEAE